MKVNIVDSTFREGLQRPGGEPFENSDAMIAYTDLAGSAAVADRFEVYMPERLKADVWAYIAERYPHLMQVYVGPSHTFDLAERPELADVPQAILSTTLIKGEPQALSGARKIFELTGMPIRAGMECSGNQDPAEAVGRFLEASEVDGVAEVVIGDSSGRMTTRWIDTFFDELPQSVQSLGFHLHENGSGSASENAKRVSENARASALDELTFDATLLGVGDRMGILALSAAAALDSNPERAESARALEANAQRLITTAYQGHGFLDQAASHFNDSGRLREEYH